jgi:hypothetical protein
MNEDYDSSLDIEDFPIACPNCDSQMRLLAIKWDTKRRDIHTFVCDLCGHTVARGVLPIAKYSVAVESVAENQESEGTRCHSRC